MTLCGNLTSTRMHCDINIYSVHRRVWGWRPSMYHRSHDCGGLPMGDGVCLQVVCIWWSASEGGVNLQTRTRSAYMMSGLLEWWNPSKKHGILQHGSIQAGSMHSTGMLSCLLNKSISLLKQSANDTCYTTGTSLSLRTLQCKSHHSQSSSRSHTSQTSQPVAVVW